MTETWNTPRDIAPIPWSSSYPQSNNGTKQTQYATRNQHDEPMLNLRGQNIRTPSRSDVITGTRNRPIRSASQDARVTRFAPCVHQPRMSPTAAPQLNNTSANASSVQADTDK